MGFAENISRHKLGVRWLMAAILGVGIVLQRATFAISLASVAYFAVEGNRIRSVSRRRDKSITQLVASSGWVLRRGFLWVLIVLATVYNVLVAADVGRAVLSAGLVYVAGVFAQTVVETRSGLSSSGDKE